MQVRPRTVRPHRERRRRAERTHAEKANDSLRAERTTGRSPYAAAAAAATTFGRGNHLSIGALGSLPPDPPPPQLRKIRRGTHIPTRRRSDRRMRDPNVVVNSAFGSRPEN